MDVGVLGPCSMDFLSLVALGFFNLGSGPDLSRDAGGLIPHLDAVLERELLAPEVLPASRPRRMVPEGAGSEEPWAPRALLRYEASGAELVAARTSPRIPSLDQGDELPFRAEGTGEGFQWSVAPAPLEPASRSRLNPWEVRIQLDPDQGSWNEGAAGFSMSAELAKLLEPLGVSLARSIFLSINIEVLGFEEYEGTDLSPIETRHVIPKFGNLASGLGIGIRF